MFCNGNFRSKKHILVFSEAKKPFGDVIHPLFNNGDEDEAMAAVRVLMEAPPEIQILAVQLINLIEEEA